MAGDEGQSWHAHKASQQQPVITGKARIAAAVLAVMTNPALRHSAWASCAAPEQTAGERDLCKVFLVTLSGVFLRLSSPVSYLLAHLSDVGLLDVFFAFSQQQNDRA